MKRFYTLLIAAVLFFGFSASIISAELASRDPQPRNVVLEEYTGIHCPYCPDGHKRANALKDANPGRVVVINVHAGSYAVPKPGEPDFRTAFGEQLVAFAGVGGFPAGSINRMVFPGAANQPPYTPQKAGVTALSRGGWAAAAADSILNGSISPVNIGAKTAWNNATRELSVDMELYFTSAIEGAVKLNLVLLESHVWGPQSGATDPAKYEHNHILRDMITGQWGEQVTKTGQGASYEKNYKYTVPENFNIENCDIAIFVTSSTNQYIYTGITQTAITPDASLSTNGILIDAKKSNESFAKTFVLKNTSEREIEFTYTVEKSERTPADWEAKVVSTENKVKLANGESANIDIALTLGATLGIGDAILTVTEVSNPDALSYSKMITAVSADAKYLEVNAGATMEPVVKSGGRNEIISLVAADYNTLATKLSPKIAIWNFGPKGGLVTAQASTIVDMMNKGIGILINGSVPLPMLSFENANHPLFTLLGITWKQGDDIQLASFSIEGIAGDPVADGLKATGNTTTNGFYLQPVTITNPTNTTAMIKNTDQNKTVSVRVESTKAKAIYLSFNLDIITNAADKTKFIKNAIDWLESTTDVNDETIEGISIYPNPSSDYVIVDGLSGLATISDLLGNKLWTGEVVEGTQIPVSNLATGMYILNINNKTYQFVKN